MKSSITINAIFFFIFVASFESHFADARNGAGLFTAGHIVNGVGGFLNSIGEAVALGPNNAPNTGSQPHNTPGLGLHKAGAITKGVGGLLTSIGEAVKLQGPANQPMGGHASGPTIGGRSDLTPQSPGLGLHKAGHIVNGVGGLLDSIGKAVQLGAVPEKQPSTGTAIVHPQIPNVDAQTHAILSALNTAAQNDNEYCVMRTMCDINTKKRKRKLSKIDNAIKNFMSDYDHTKGDYGAAINMYKQAAVLGSLTKTQTCAAVYKTCKLHTNQLTFG